jgi:hypothetical protein
MAELIQDRALYLLEILRQMMIQQEPRMDGSWYFSMVRKPGAFLEVHGEHRFFWTTWKFSSTRN